MVHIEDPDALDKLCALEGENWLELQHRRPEAPYSFFVILEAWNLKKSLGDEYADEPLSTFLSGGDSNVLYGEGGWARFVVRSDGEIRLVASSTREVKVRKAVELGFALC